MVAAIHRHGGSGKAAVFRRIAQQRRSCARFQRNDDAPLPTEIVKDILESTIRSPSSFNTQPTQVVLVQDAFTKRRLADAGMIGLGNQHRVLDCSAVAVFLSDLEPDARLPRILALERDWGHRHPNHLALLPLQLSVLVGQGTAATWIKNRVADLVSGLRTTNAAAANVEAGEEGEDFLRSPPPGTNGAMPVFEPVQAWSYKNTAMAVQSYVLAATSHDLATAVMEGFDARRVKELLRVPDRYDIPMMVATGYEYREPAVGGEREPGVVGVDDEDGRPATPRLPLEQVVFDNSFGNPWEIAKAEEETRNS